MFFIDTKGPQHMNWLECPEVVELFEGLVKCLCPEKGRKELWNILFGATNSLFKIESMDNKKNVKSDEYHLSLQISV